MILDTLKSTALYFSYVHCSRVLDCSTWSRSVSFPIQELRRATCFEQLDNEWVQTEFSGPPWETARLPSEAVCIIRASPTCAWRVVLTCLDMSAAWEKAHLPPVSVTSEDAAGQRDAWALNFFKVKWFISYHWWKACGLKSSSRTEIKTCFALWQNVMHAISGSSSNRDSAEPSSCAPA